ncbi:hypothetical protein ACF1GT_21585 [Streptomyces sp. NPDC014636]|uniref:hypothetical protein n=1 Tax=Streptomyces sp. NPDC014636 TaxID=3364876 RepID=UPI0036F9A422
MTATPATGAHRHTGLRAAHAAPTGHGNPATAARRGHGNAGHLRSARAARTGHGNPGHRPRPGTATAARCGPRITAAGGRSGRCQPKLSWQSCAISGEATPSAWRHRTRIWSAPGRLEAGR